MANGVNMKDVTPKGVLFELITRPLVKIPVCSAKQVYLSSCKETKETFT